MTIERKTFTALTDTTQSAESLAVRDTEGNFTVQLTLDTVTAGVFELLGTLTPKLNNWAVLAQHTLTAAEITAGVAVFHVAGKGVAKVSVKMDSLSGTSVEASVKGW